MQMIRCSVQLSSVHSSLKLEVSCLPHVLKRTDYLTHCCISREEDESVKLRYRIIARLLGDIPFPPCYLTAAIVFAS